MNYRVEMLRSRFGGDWEVLGEYEKLSRAIIEATRMYDAGMAEARVIDLATGEEA